MKKKIFLFSMAILALTLGVVGMSAYEAHIINVTARIENALSVTPDEIAFGTVFPQEMLSEGLSIGMSQSFLDETRVDDIEYVIKQKPKVRVLNEDTGKHDPYAVIFPSTYPDGIVAHEYCLNESPADVGDVEDEYYDFCYPNLCGQLSEHKDADEGVENDTEVDAPHDPALGTAIGRLAKSELDEEDNWLIDLIVPCFEGMCDQAYDPAIYGEPMDARLEHEVFGCDLWIEITDISETGELGECGDGIQSPFEQCDDGMQCSDGTDCTGNPDACIGIGDDSCATRDNDGCSANCRVEDLGCLDKADVMLVLDRSGSIGGDLGTLQDAAKAFVDALAPSTDGVHIGQVSFSTNANLDVHLTENGQTVKDAIDLLVSSGLTNLEEGLLFATAELANPGDGDDRDDSDSPDYIVVITDGDPTTSVGPFDDETDAANAADAARAAGASIYVVGVGADLDPDYLSTYIANHTGKYFDAGDFGELSDILADIASCEN